MNKIEEIIRNNTYEFNRSEPSEDHFAKMQEKLNKLNAENKKRKKFNINSFLRYASIFILIISTTYFAVTINSAKASCNNIASYQETQDYYNLMINEQIAELQKREIKTGELELIKNEIYKIQDQFDENVDDVCENPDNEQVINSIVQNYKLKVKVINKITQ